MFDHVEKLKDYIRCQSVSADSTFAAGMEQAREFVSSMLRDLGLRVEIIATNKQPVVLATRDGDPSWPHVVIYGHYDVQPPDPLALWKTKPFEPEIVGERIYGRGAADNKGPFLVHVAALAQLLAENPRLPLRVTMVIEGEEEIGSPSFGGFLEANAGRLRGDLWFLSDTANASVDQVVITCGLRGIVTFDVEITSARGDLHSGLHGGAFRNPIHALAELIASLHTPDARVAIPGFYDDVVPVEDWEREELKKLGKSAEEYRTYLGVPRFHTPPGYNPFEAIRFLPTMECNGIGGGYQGEGSKTVIPSRAFAKMSCRLVGNQRVDKIWELVNKTLLERCPPDVTMKVTLGHAGNPYIVVPPGRPNTPKDQPRLLATAFAACDEGAREFFGRPPLYLREGGSVPIISEIKRVVGVDTLLLGMFLPEDNLHAPNESFHLGVMEKGIRVSKRVLSSLAAARR